MSLQKAPRYMVPTTSKKAPIIDTSFGFMPSGRVAADTFLRILPNPPSIIPLER
jgi:hypothetical protein